MLSDEEKLSFLSKISSKLLELHGITTYEYELLKEIKIDQSNERKDSIDYSLDNPKKVGEENNSNEQKIENKLIQEKIKTNLEKIYSYIKDKKEYEFITDYFITEFDPSISTNFIQKNSQSDIINHKESNLSENGINNFDDFDNINEEFLIMLSKANLQDINSITKFNEGINKNYKSKSGEIPNLSINKKKSSGLKEEDIFLPEMKKAQSYNINKINTDIGLKSKEEMDKELEEEINRQIFGYTRKMKESAKNFGVQLKKDNQTLNKIESLQDKVNDKTTKQVKRLQEFNYSIKLGFCKLMFLMFTVFGTFIGTMFVIKIFPKLA